MELRSSMIEGNTNTTATGGNGIFADIGARLVIDNSIVTNNTGYGLFVSESAHVDIRHSNMTRNSFYGVYNEAGDVFVDNSSVICRNEPMQHQGLITGQCLICGTIWSITCNSQVCNDTLQPGIVVKVDGDILNDQNDTITEVVMGSVTVGLLKKTIPFTFTLPLRPDEFFGPLEFYTDKGRMAVTMDSFLFEQYVIECPVSVSSGPSPYIMLTNTPTDVTVHLDIGCAYIPPITCYFNDDHRVSASVSYDRAVCAAPTDIDAGLVPIALEISLPGFIYNITSMLEFYSLPIPTSVTPSVAHNTTTNITLCGLTYYDWSEPRCVFESTVYVNASWINSTCITCRFYSSYPCRDSSIVQVAASLYGDHVSKTTVQVIHACEPMVTDAVRIDPTYVIRSNMMDSVSILIDGIETHNSSNLLCKFNALQTRAVYINSSVIRCAVPLLNDSGSIMISVSNDFGHNWYAVTTLDVVSSCEISLVRGPLPVHLSTVITNTIHYELNIECGYHPQSVTCRIDDDVVAMVSGHSITCLTPARPTVGEVGVLIVVQMSGFTYNVSSSNLIYYPMPVPTSVTPNVAHNTTTNITLCGLTYYDWSEPRCVFESTVYVNASWVDEECIICRFDSSSVCGDHAPVSVRASLLMQQISLPALTVTDACLPTVSDGVLLLPKYITMTSKMNSSKLFVNGVDVVNSLQMACRFGDVLTRGYFVSDQIMQCNVPYVSDAAIVMLSISVDGQNFVNVSTFEFSNGGSLYCDAGHETVNSMCVPCKQSYYKDNAGTDECRICGDNMITTTTGADNRTLCGCLRGYSAIVQNGVVYKCVECDDRVYCPGGHSPASTKPGYYIVNDVIVTCIPESACMSNSMCTPGYHGPRCSSCESGYYRIDHECLECSRTSTSWRVPLLIIMSIFGLSYLLKQALGGRRTSFKIVAISIIYNFLQIFALIGNVPGKVNEPFKSTFQTANAINLDVQLFAFECETFDMDFFQYYTVKLLTLPAAMVILWIIVMIVMTTRTMCNTTHSVSDILSAGISTTILTTTLLYLALTSSVLSYVSCAVLEDGTWVLDASPDIECFGTEHLNNLSQFIGSLLVYVIGIPIALYYIIVIKRKRLLKKYESNLPDLYKSRYGFLSMKYRPQIYWWELVVMLRKALLVAAFTIWSRTIELKIEVAALILIAATFLQRSYRPLLDDSLERMESVTLLFNSMVLVAGLGVFVSDEEQVSSEVAYLLFILMVIMCICVLLWIVLTIYRHVVASLNDDDDACDTVKDVSTELDTVDDDVLENGQRH